MRFSKAQLLGAAWACDLVASCDDEAAWADKYDLTTLHVRGHIDAVELELGVQAMNAAYADRWNACAAHARDLGVDAIGRPEVGFLESGGWEACYAEGAQRLRERAEAP